MIAIPKIFVDTNVYKFSATALPVLRPRNVTSQWGGRETVVTLYDQVLENPNDRIDNPELKTETNLLREVAALAEAGRVTFMESTEVWIETTFLPKMASASGYFYGAHVERAKDPIIYSRVLFGGPEEPANGQFNFLSGLKAKRFLELQRMTGAYQGEGKPANRNQLLDAFHLWCAEHNDCDYFLSLDFKLARIVNNTRKTPTVRIVKPSELLLALREVSA